MPHGTAQMTTSRVTSPTAPRERRRRWVTTVAAAMPASRHRAYVWIATGPRVSCDHTGSGLGMPVCMRQPYRAPDATLVPWNGPRTAEAQALAANLVGAAG